MSAALIGQRVRVHLNLHRGDWTVTQKGKVIAKVPALILGDVRFIVSEATRQKVLAKGQRAVHAWVEGVVLAAAPRGAETEITYNPFRCGAFHTRDGRVVRGGHQADAVRFGDEVYVNAKGKRYRKAYGIGNIG